jgi:hypothetical protein
VSVFSLRGSSARTRLPQFQICFAHFGGADFLAVSAARIYFQILLCVAAEVLHFKSRSSLLAVNSVLRDLFIYPSVAQPSVWVSTRVHACAVCLAQSPGGL